MNISDYISPSHKIDNVSDALDILKKLRKYFDERIQEMYRSYSAYRIGGKLPFGIWFRGQIREWPLTPAIFRRPDGKVFDETSIFIHFTARYPEFSATHRNSFDWLTLMQHYRTPTRLLDWSESILVALYFAVELTGTRDDSSDGILYVLDARRLNEKTIGQSWMKSRERSDVLIRSQMAEARQTDEWSNDIKRLMSQGLVSHDEYEEIECKKIDAYCNPIAVYPARLNNRMIFQGSVFTLHGGKVNVYDYDDPIPEPISIEEVNESSPHKFLTWCKIDASKKSRIKDELFSIGIHEASLFPELDRQSNYLKEQWSHDIGPRRSSPQALLKHAGAWEGDDLKELLQEVYAARGKIEL